MLLRWQEFATRSVAVLFWHATTVPVAVANMVSVKARVVDWKTGVCHIVPAVLECSNCSLHTTVGRALSETGATVSLSTVLRLSLLSRQSCRLSSGRTGDAPCVHTVSNYATFRWLSLLCGSERQFSGNSAQKDRQEHCKTPWWQCWFGGSQPQWRESLVVITTLTWSKSLCSKKGGSLKFLGYHVALFMWS